MDLNNIVVYGRLTADATTFMFDDNRGTINFRLAQNYKVRVNGQQVDKVNFFACAAPFVALAPYMLKGKPVIVSGRINQDNYTDKNGIERREYKIYATEVQLLNDQPQQDNMATTQRQPAQSQPAQPQQVIARQVEQTPYSMEDPNSPPF